MEINEMGGKHFDGLTPEEQLVQIASTNNKIDGEIAKFGIQNAIKGIKATVLGLLISMGLTGTALAKDNNELSYDISGYNEKYDESKSKNPLFVGGGVEAGNRNTTFNIEGGNKNVGVMGKFGDKVNAGLLTWQVGKDWFFKSSTALRNEEVKGTSGSGDITQFTQAIEGGHSFSDGSSLSAYASVMHSGNNTLSSNNYFTSTENDVLTETSSYSSKEKFKGVTIGNTGLKYAKEGDGYDVYLHGGPSVDEKGVGFNAGVGGSVDLSDITYAYAEATAIVLPGKAGTNMRGEGGLGINPTDGVDFRLAGFAGKNYEYGREKEQFEYGGMAYFSVTTDKVAEVLFGNEPQQTTRGAISSNPRRNVVQPVPTAKMGFDQTFGKMQQQVSTSSSIEYKFVPNIEVDFKGGSGTYKGFVGVGSKIVGEPKLGGTLNKDSCRVFIDEKGYLHANVDSGAGGRIDVNYSNGTKSGTAVIRNIFTP